HSFIHVTYHRIGLSIADKPFRNHFSTFDTSKSIAIKKRRRKCGRFASPPKPTGFEYKMRGKATPCSRAPLIPHRAIGSVGVSGLFRNQNQRLEKGQHSGK